MDVTGRLLRVAARRPHPFLAVAPGATAVRLAAERECRQRGWPLAATPAEADLLVTCGRAGPALSGVLDRVWEQMAEPRARAAAHSEEDLSAALDAGRGNLADPAGQRAGAAARVAPESEGGGGGSSGDGETDAGALDMAGRAADRDGLTLDVLHVPLGPVLPDWPAGLVVHTALQGDVVQEGTPRVLDAGASPATTPFWDEPWLRARAGEPVSLGYASRRRAAAHLDSLGRLLAVAGWPEPSSTARKLRDEILAGADGAALAAALAARFERFARRVRRSLLLRWMTDGVGVLDARATGLDRVGGPASRAGSDVTGRWLRWLDECDEALAAVGSEQPLDPGAGMEGPRGRLDGGDWPSRTLLDALPHLLEGAELARARLVVASLDPDPDELVGVGAWAEASHG